MIKYAIYSQQLARFMKWSNLEGKRAECNLAVSLADLGNTRRLYTPEGKAASKSAAADAVAAESRQHPPASVPLIDVREAATTTG
jgi:hypothetical protein